jgi:ketosteroid isomerase-like protein
MAHPNEELLRDATDKLNAGDMEGFLGLHTDDVVMHITGRNQLSGDYKGRQEVGGVFQRQMQLLDGPPEFEVHDVFGSDGHAVLLGTQRAKRGGKTIESNAAVVAHVTDGKFNEVWVVPTDPYAEDEFLA